VPKVNVRAVASLAAVLVLSSGVLFVRARGLAAPPAAAVAGAPARPRLVVLLVIDQLPSWSFEVQSPSLRFGLRRLLDEGVYFSRAQYPYATTSTAAGHAALGQGAAPGTTGIVSNQWYDRATSDTVSSVEDTTRALLRIGARPAEPSVIAERAGASPHRLRVEGVGDILRAETAGLAKIVGIAGKDRSAILPVGHHPTIAVWYDKQQKAFTTSTYYLSGPNPRPPRWLERLAKEHPVAPRLSWAWNVLDPKRLAAAAAGWPDDGAGEGGNEGLGATFPHSLAAVPRPEATVVGTPLLDEMTGEAAWAAVQAESLGRDGVPDLLTISFSAHDYAAHWWGQESWEAIDTLQRVDRTIGQLLDRLDRYVGKGRYAVILSSDHGATRLVDKSRSEGKAAFRVAKADVRSVAEAAAVKVAGVLKDPRGWIIANDHPSLYLNDEALTLPFGLRDRVEEAIVAALRKMDGIAYAYRTNRWNVVSPPAPRGQPAFAAAAPGGGATSASGTVAPGAPVPASATTGPCDGVSGVEAMVCLSVDAPGPRPRGEPPRIGEIYYGVAPNSVLQEVTTAGTSHGSASDDDRTVPIIVLRPGVPPRRVDEPVSMLQVAPTLAKLLGVSAPPAAREPPLNVTP
jgi:arylsulfatase A-like enzyme